MFQTDIRVISYIIIPK